MGKWFAGSKNQRVRNQRVRNQQVKNQQVRKQQVRNPERLISRLRKRKRIPRQEALQLRERSGTETQSNWHPWRPSAPG